MASDPAAVAARARALGMVLTLHAMSWDLNATSRLDAVRAASMDALHQSIALAARLGARAGGDASGARDDAIRRRRALLARVWSPGSGSWPPTPPSTGCASASSTWSRGRASTW